MSTRKLALAAFCTVLCAAMGVLFATRWIGSIIVEHDRNPRFVTLSDGSIRNAFTVKIANCSASPREFELVAEGLAEARLEIIGVQSGRKIAVAEDGAQSLRVTLTSQGEHVGAVRFIARDAMGDVPGAGDRFVAQ